MDQNIPNFIEDDGTYDLGFGYYVTKEYIDSNHSNDLSKINAYMADFELPYAFMHSIVLKEDTLNIFVDNFISEIKPKSGAYLFIDHHILEVLKEQRNSSNAYLMYHKLNKIISFLKDLFEQFHFSNINVFYHADIDGVSSGVMMMSILNMIKDDKEYIADDFNQCLLYGEIGDISDDVDKRFNKKQSMQTRKVIKLSAKYCSIIFKTVRPFLKEKNIKNFVEDISYLTPKIAENMIYSINKYIEKITKINNPNNAILLLMTRLNINNVGELIYKDYIFKKDNLVERFIETKEPNLFYKGTYNGNDYIIMIIDCPYDIGRSIMWTIKAKLKYILSNNAARSDWKFNLTADVSNKKLFSKAFDYMICYNGSLEKGSSHSIDNSAYEMAKDFGGGGHDVKDGSLGSFELSMEEFFEKLEVIPYDI
ncbi:hypothetical protein EOM09_02805 [bacterium]|nr:hypothetical protein [bacterium]